MTWGLEGSAGGGRAHGKVASPAALGYQGFERMPHDVGHVIVPEIATESRDLGEARLYDCLFTDQW